MATKSGRLHTAAFMRVRREIVTENRKSYIVFTIYILWTVSSVFSRSNLTYKTHIQISVQVLLLTYYFFSHKSQHLHAYIRGSIFAAQVEKSKSSTAPHITHSVGGKWQVSILWYVLWREKLVNINKFVK